MHIYVYPKAQNQIHGHVHKNQQKNEGIMENQTFNCNAITTLLVLYWEYSHCLNEPKYICLKALICEQNCCLLLK